ncbi:MAG: hypothetical protein QM765_28115 [Myxococcales bacterium]
MKSTLFAALMLVSVPAAAFAAEPAGACPALVPGKSLGERFVLGTVLKEDSAVQPDAVSGWFRPKDPAGASVRLRFDADKKLVEFEAPLPTCLMLGGKRVEVSDAHTLAAALGTCGPEAILEGGNVIECAGARLSTGLKEKALRVLVQPAPSQLCAVYVAGSKWFDAAGAHESVLEVKEKPVCVDGVSKALTSQVSLSDFKAATGSSCREEALRGATHLTCGERRYSFAGPKLMLSQISVKK